MRSIRLLLLAATSAALVVGAIGAARPRYGSTLEVQLRAPLSQFDPTQTGGDAETVHVRDRISRMVYDRLIEVDQNGKLTPGLALTWNRNRNEHQWTIWLRANVTVQDGSQLTLADVVASLHVSHPNWRVENAGETIVVESDDPIPNLPYELAAPENSIVVRRGDKSFGTGPFTLDGFQPGKSVTLRAFDRCWAGRPFVDVVNLRLGAASREQLAYFEVNGASVIEPELDARSPNLEGAGQFLSRPTDLVAIAFPPSLSERDHALRESIAQALDRATLANVLLQHRAEAAYGLLPQWMSGYEKTLEAPRNLARAKELSSAMAHPAITIAYDASDPVTKIVAERVVLNAREAGVEVMLHSMSAASQAGVGEARLLHLAMRSSNPVLALIDFARPLQRESQFAQHELRGEQQWFDAERAVMEGFQVIPIVHVDRVVMIAPYLRNFAEAGNGDWKPEDVWMERNSLVREGGR